MVRQCLQMAYTFVQKSDSSLKKSFEELKLAFQGQMSTDDRGSEWA